MLPLLFLISIIPALVAIAPLVKGTDLFHYEPLPGFYHVELILSIALMSAGASMIILPFIFAIGWCVMFMVSGKRRRSLSMIILSVATYLLVFVVLVSCAVYLFNNKGLDQAVTNKWNNINETMKSKIEITYKCCGWNELPTCCNSSSSGSKCCQAATYSKCNMEVYPYILKIAPCIYNVSDLYDDINNSCGWWSVWGAVVALFALFFSSALLFSKTEEFEYTPIPTPVYIPPPPMHIPKTEWGIALVKLN
jgi:hypothetical protein